jgi:hypothetical protein
MPKGGRMSSIDRLRTMEPFLRTRRVSKAVEREREREREIERERERERERDRERERETERERGDHQICNLQEPPFF